MLLQAAGMRLGRWNGIGTWHEAEEEEEEEEEFRPIRKGFLACSSLKHEPPSSCIAARSLHCGIHAVQNMGFPCFTVPADDHVQ